MITAKIFKTFNMGLASYRLGYNFTQFKINLTPTLRSDDDRKGNLKRTSRSFQADRFILPFESLASKNVKKT